jgi:hypothetical protein
MCACGCVCVCVSRPIFSFFTPDSEYVRVCVCVSRAIFSFFAPDGEFTLLTYRIAAAFRPPILVKCLLAPDDLDTAKVHSASNYTGLSRNRCCPGRCNSFSSWPIWPHFYRRVQAEYREPPHWPGA